MPKIGLSQTIIYLKIYWEYFERVFSMTTLFICYFNEINVNGRFFY